MNKSFIVNKKIRIFPFFTSDIAFCWGYSIELGYLLTLIIDKIGKNINDIKITNIYPFKNYFANLLENIGNYDEDIFIFYLENNFHSSNYLLNGIKEILKILNKKNINKTIIIQSYKIGKNESIKLMEKYHFIKIIVRTDLELFFELLCIKKKKINQISNIIYRNECNNIVESKNEQIDSNINEYIYGAYYNGYLEFFQDDFDKRRLFFKEINHIDETTGKKHNIKKLFRNSAFLSTGRGCFYDCIYCFRGIKYNKIRNIEINTIKKDLDYLEKNNYKSVKFIDDCFVTSNLKRLDEIFKLLGSYNLFYKISIKYEIISPKILEYINNSNIIQIQIGLQSTNPQTNKIILRQINTNNFKNLISKLKLNGKFIVIDIILGLPGDSLKDFINTFQFAIELMPSAIAINTLFINPGTQLFNNLKKYGIKQYKYKKQSSNYYFNVNRFFSSSSFTYDDYIKAKKYIRNIQQLYKNQLIIYNR